MLKSKGNVRNWTGRIDSIYILTKQYIEQYGIVTGQSLIDEMVKETGIEIPVWKPAEIDTGAREAVARRIRNRNAKSQLIKI